MITQDLINKLMLTESKKYKKQHIDNRRIQNQFNKDLVQELKELVYESK